MDYLLGESEFINDFNDIDRSEVVAACKDKYEKIYESYANTVDPSVEVMEQIIDMYLFLGIPPSERLLEIIKDYLLRGITFSKLDIYMHLPEYATIVKFLRPSFYNETYEIRSFTINEYFYKLASERYQIKDDFKNAYSIWYIDYLLDKGLKFSDRHIYYLLEHGPAVCANYLMEIDEPKFFPVYAKNIFSMIIETNNIQGFKIYAKGKLYEHDYIVKLIKEYNRTEMIQYMGILMDIDIDEYSRVNRRLDVLRQFRNVYNDIPRNIATGVLSSDWYEGIEYIIQNGFLRVSYLYDVYEHNRAYLKEVYNKLLEHTPANRILSNCITETKLFRVIHAYNPIDVNLIKNMYRASKRVAKYCVALGYKITKDDIIDALYRHRKIALYFISETDIIDKSIMVSAVEELNYDAIKLLRNKGYAWDVEYTNIAKEYGLDNMYQWLCSEGCPVE